MTEFPKDYKFQESEKKWQAYWQEQKIYSWNSNETRENSFVVDTPPPTVSGQLHIGHVFSYTQADFIVRFWRMQGKNIFYPIGFDDNGLPTERLVEKQKQVRAVQIDRQEFIEICQEVVAVEEEKFRNLFNHIALSVDWSLEYQTISPLSRKISQMSFLDLVEKGEIYRSSQPMLWDPVDQTALAQADIEDKEKTSKMNDIIFKTEDEEEITIATTRPELLPACVAVFFHPDDERYKHLTGKNAISPLFEVKVPLLADEMVNPEKGTGLVMCCTFGDLTDIHWWKTHKLRLKIILNKRGVIEHINFDEDCLNLERAKHFAQQITGLKVNEARSKIVEILKLENLLTKEVEITQTVKCAERSGAPLEILTTPQWFIRAIDHKENMLKRSEELNWHPKSMKIRLDNWIKSVAWDWCISRQRFFGVPFPVWYSKRAGEEGRPLFANPSQLPVDPLKDLPLGYSKDEVEPDYDVMDTWATSAVSPQLSTHAINEKFAVDFNRHQRLFPVDLRPQAHEILRTWAYDTMLKAHLHQDSLPWHNIMISGWCLAEDRSKMSKSKGNIINPEKLLEQYGSDVVRYWAATSKLGADTTFSEDVLKNGKRLVNKLWNAAKFVSHHFVKLEDADKKAELADVISKVTRLSDKWLISKLIEVINCSENEFRNYEYAAARENVEQFFWSVFCDNYLEIVKVRSYNEDGSDQEGQYSAILTLYHSLKILLKLFAPFMPHITEELYQVLFPDGTSIHTRGSWPSTKLICSKDEMLAGDQLVSVLDLVRKAKAEKNLSIKAPISLLEIKGVNLSEDLLKDLANVTSSNEVKLVKEFTTEGQLIIEQDLAINAVYTG